MKYKYIMWDWNGTILDDLTINFEIINTLLAERSLKQMASTEIYKEAFDFPIINFYLALGFNFEEESFSDVARQYSFMYDERFYETEIFPDAEGVLRRFKELGIEQIIVSASQESLLQKQVAYHKIDHLFTDIIGTRDIYANSKVDFALQWMANGGISANEVLFVGDTPHDFEVAESIGCDCVLIERGHCSAKRLSSLGVCVVKSIEELEKLVKQ